MKHPSILFLESNDIRPLSLGDHLNHGEYAVTTCDTVDAFLDNINSQQYNLAIMPFQPEVERSAQEVISVVRMESKQPELPVMVVCDPEQFDFNKLSRLVDLKFICLYSTSEDPAFIQLKCKSLLTSLESIPVVEIPDNLQQAIQMMDKLSKREDEILQLIGDGLSNKEISKNLTLSEHSVRTHIYNIFSKLNIKRRSQAVLLNVYRKYGKVSPFVMEEQPASASQQ